MENQNPATSENKDPTKAKPLVLTWDQCHQPWHLIMPGDPDYIDPKKH